MNALCFDGIQNRPDVSGYHREMGAVPLYPALVGAPQGSQQQLALCTNPNALLNAPDPLRGSAFAAQNVVDVGPLQAQAQSLIFQHTQILSPLTRIAQPALRGAVTPRRCPLSPQPSNPKTVPFEFLRVPERAEPSYPANASRASMAESNSPRFPITQSNTAPSTLPTFIPAPHP